MCGGDRCERAALLPAQARQAGAQTPCGYAAIASERPEKSWFCSGRQKVAGAATGHRALYGNNNLGTRVDVLLFLFFLPTQCSGPTRSR